jgi:hypothetical protein
MTLTTESELTFERYLDAQKDRMDARSDLDSKAAGLQS